MSADMLAAEAGDSRPGPCRACLLGGLLLLLVVLYGCDAPHWGGWVLLYAALILPWLDTRRPAPRGWRWAVFAVVLCHAAAAVIAVFVAPLPGAGVDAVSFHDSAVNRTSVAFPLTYSLGADFYKSLLETVYVVTGPSLLVGNALSVAAFAASCLMFVRLMDMLGVSRGWLMALLLFGLLPSALVLTSSTLREPFQLMFFMGAVYLGVRGRVEDRKLLLGLCAVAFVLMGAFHQILLLYAVPALMLILLWPLRGRDGTDAKILPRLLFLGAAVGLVALTLMLVPTPRGDDYVAMLERDALNALARYRAGVDIDQPRTSFGVDLDVSSLAGFAATSLKVYAYYMFSPFPRQIDQLQDVYVLLESWMRAALLVLSMIGFVRQDGGARRSAALLLMLYLGMTYLWALGTTNFGQATRHHVLSNWLLMLTGAAAYSTLAAGRRAQP